METIRLKKMAKSLRLLVIGVVITVLSLALFPETALSMSGEIGGSASGSTSVSFSIPVEQSFHSTVGSEVEAGFTYELKRLDSSNPLPAGAVADTFDFSLIGNESKDIRPLTFTHGGFYAYEIKLTSTEELGFTLDNTIYTLIIAVSNIAEGELSAEMRAVYTRPPETSPEAKSPLEGGRVLFSHKHEAPLARPESGKPESSRLESKPAQKADPPFKKEVPPSTGLTRGPKTGDYADPTALLAAMIVSAAIVLFTLLLIYVDKRNEKEYQWN